MAFTFVQSTGRFFRGEFSAASKFEAWGYSGHDKGKNNPSMQEIHDIGPLPRGCYTIGPMYHHLKLGPMTFDLTPDVGVQQFGRSAFRIHGDSIATPGSASHGCICLGPTARAYINAARQGLVDEQKGLIEPFVDARLEVIE